jgi:hypothetical protein
MGTVSNRGALQVATVHNTFVLSAICGAQLAGHSHQVVTKLCPTPAHCEQDVESIVICVTGSNHVSAFVLMHPYIKMCKVLHNNTY